MSSIQEVATKVKTLIEAVSGIGDVSDRPGGVKTWAKRNVRNSYWELDITNVSREPAEIGTAAFKFYTVRIEGFLPYSYTNPNSTETWRGLVDNVCSKLEQNMSLLETINDGGLPQVVINDRVMVDGMLTTSDEGCHHCTIEWNVREYYTFSTT